MEQTRQSANDNAQASFSGPQLSTRLSDELVFRILDMVNAEPKGWKSIIECSYASKVFHEMAMRLLWAHPQMVIERQTGDRFVVGAMASGRHTRRLWLSAVQEHSLERGTAAIRFMPELEVLDVSGRMQNSMGPLEDWLASPKLKHVAIDRIAVLPLQRTSLSSSLVSLDLGGIDYLDIGVFSDLLSSDVFPQLRALALSSFSNPARDEHQPLFPVLPDAFLAQLDMLQVNPRSFDAPGFDNNLPNKVPLLTTLVIGDGSACPPLAPTVTYHLALTRLDAFLPVLHTSFKLAAVAGATHLSRLLFGRLEHRPRSFWVAPKVYTDLSIARNDEWAIGVANIAALAEMLQIPGTRFTPNSVPTPRETTAGSLSWDFWEYAKGLRAQGRT
ncbi:hypothetical protein Rhopal_002511-T1 [Rhodotorula paludigena]|uniref:F-box domain-containing protein n=1 Tax=Rhodotorula paludigena TaxID=86838 RepID=A0AAV5GJY8_9BASI|nr:hypothetical protein Rhopal_002511-T1 [Rhodotorula paludigena]